MSLDEEIGTARKEIFSDGYDMSVGEVMNLYRDQELRINPAFQRLFRWDQTQKTRFIESLLLGIPIPPIFVVQDERGVWELIDGLQRLSTVLEFSGLLKDPNGQLVPPSVLEGTSFLPSLAGKHWEPSADDIDDGIGKAQQLQVKRARLRVEILKKESDPKAKYELFQRLNTGGAQLTPQEVRNCVAVMVNPVFHEWLTNLSREDDFVTTTAQTQTALEQQIGVELTLRFFAFLHMPYQGGLDVHEYLDQALETLATDEQFSLDHEADRFRQVFRLLNRSLGDGAFRKWSEAAQAFQGKFLMSLFEVVAVGVAHNIDAILALGEQQSAEFVKARVKALPSHPVFIDGSGAGVRGTTRLAALLPLGPGFFQP